MVKISVASVLLVTTLQQLVVYCNNVNIRHIHLSLDENSDESFNNIKERYKYKELKGRIDEGNDHFRLYISAKYALKPSKASNEDKELVWGDDKTAKDLAATVHEMFRCDAIVIVVFSKCNIGYYGFGFQETFEEEIQKSHRNIAIGREKVHVYLFLDEKEDFSIKSFKETLHEHNKHISIAANKELKFYNLWSENLRAESVSQVLIHEADTVEIRLKATCAKTNTELTVGGLDRQSLAFKLKDVVEAKGQTHPEQTLRIRMPKDCKHFQQINQFTDELINDLRNQHFDVYGKEPSAVLHFAAKTQPNDEDFPLNARRKMEADFKEDGNTRSYLAVFDHSKGIVDSINDINKKNVKNTDLYDIKSLSIQVHCHGKNMLSGFTVCESNAETLAREIKKIVPKEIDQVQIIFYVCKVGTEIGHTFVKELLKNLKGIKVEEVIHFELNIAMLCSRPNASFPCSDRYEVYKDVDIPFGRFTTKHKKKTNGYQNFLVLPKTEYNLIYPNKYKK